MKLGLRNNPSRTIHQFLRLCLIGASVALVIGAAAIGLARTPDPIRTEINSAPQSSLNSQADSVELLKAVSIVAPALKPATRIVTMEVTAYCACTRCCGPNAQGITASGKDVSYNAGKFVAADRAVPFGTRMVIPGYHDEPVEVIDRGGAIKGNKLDVFFPTHQEALEWGRQTVAVTVIE